MAQLGVKLNHVATLRQVRGGGEPNLAAAAVLAEMGGADWIIAHLREDRRHIQERDVSAPQQIVASKLTIEIPLAEGAPPPPGPPPPSRPPTARRGRSRSRTPPGWHPNSGYRPRSATALPWM